MTVWLWIAISVCLGGLAVSGALIGKLFRIIDRDREARKNRAEQLKECLPPVLLDKLNRVAEKESLLEKVGVDLIKIADVLEEHEGAINGLLKLHTEERPGNLTPEGEKVLEEAEVSIADKAAAMAAMEAGE